VLDWRKQQTTRAMVFTTIKDILDQLPRAYSKELYDQKCDVEQYWVSLSLSVPQQVVGEI
jgi:hypothetical protein